MKKIIICLIAFCWVSTQLITAQSPQKNITLEDIWKNGTFYPKTLTEVIPSSKGDYYFTFEDGIMINKNDFKTGKMLETIVRMSELIPEGDTKAIAIDDFWFSKDESKLLISTENQSIYRHSKISKYYVCDLKTKKLSLIAKGERCRDAMLSPDATKVTYEKDNNMYVEDLGTHLATQITTDGKWNYIINGSADWVYEEEFDLLHAFSWSPDGKYIAFYRFDETKVKEYEMAKYSGLYPEEFKYKYPKAGEENSVVQVYVYDVAANKKQMVDVGSVTDQYLPKMMWTAQPNKLCVYRMNRLQNKLELLLADAANGSTKIIYSEENKWYVDLNEYLQFTSDAKSFFICSEKDGYNHIYHYDLSGKLINQVTSGNWNVTEISGIDDKAGKIYFISTEESPLNRDIYSIRFDGSQKERVFKENGQHAVTFSNSFNYCIHSYSNAGLPKQFALMNLSNGKLIKTLEDNKQLQQTIKEYNFSRKEFFTFNTTENISLHAWMIKPVDFDSTKKYPVLMYVYGGPGSQTVENRWEVSDFAWFQLLAQKGYIVVSVDNRGTGFRSEEFKKCTYQQLGKYETIDQIEAAKYLGSLKYIDKNRIGMFGWSYGGYMSALCMTEGADYFKAGIAVAPVSNWRYYDDIYTERFMRTPQENPKGYDDNSPVSSVKKLKGKLLIIHGSADDNVHLQNSMELIKALIKENKQFDMFIYPDKNHSILGAGTRLNLYVKMTNFILNNL
ncbi:MAG: S9 family peptidase [Bacteroidota bacterium]